MKYLITVFLGFFLSNVKANDYGFLFTPLENHNDVINFKYKKPIEGMIVSGTFDPNIWDCMNTFKGKVNLNFTRVEDNKSFNVKLDKVTFFDSSICIEPIDYEKGCRFKNNIVLEYTETDDYFNEQPLKILDIDFDNQKEIVFKRECGTRFFTEYEAYEFYNNKSKFDIDRKQLQTIEDNNTENEYTYGKRNNSFFYNSRSNFDEKNKTISIYESWSSAACGNETLIYKIKNNKPKLFKKIILDYENQNSESCKQKTYIIDKNDRFQLIENSP